MEPKSDSTGVFGLLLPDFQLPESDNSPNSDPFNIAVGGPSDLDSKHGTYLSNLTSYGIERLSREPSRVKGELSGVRQQLQELAFRSYKGFVGSAECITSVREDMHDIDSHLTNMETILPDLSNKCNDFTDSSGEISKSRRRQQLMLQQHGTLLELLEIPQLMDTCVRNGYLEEALELEHFVKRLARSHGEISVLKRLANDVDRSSRAMEHQLISLLRQDSKLPAFLRAVSYLRRLGTRSERDLRVAFLKCRTVWLEQLLDAIPRDHAASFLSKLTDYYRVNVLDIITQYRAIFASDTVETTESISSSPLTEWMVDRVSTYMSEFHAMLGQVKSGASLADIIDQSTRLATSLGRAGCDFRQLLAPMFNHHIEQMFVVSVEMAFDKFTAHVTSLKSGQVAGTILPTMYSRVEGWSSHVETPAVDLPPESTLSPPTSLLLHPPLAVLCNTVVGAMNELRHCAPIAIRDLIRNKFESILAQIAENLVDLAKKVRADGRSAEQRRIVESVIGLSDSDLFPFFCQLYNVIYEAHGTRGINAAQVSVVLAPFLSSKIPPPRVIQKVVDHDGLGSLLFDHRALSMIPNSEFVNGEIQWPS